MSTSAQNTPVLKAEKFSIGYTDKCIATGEQMRITPGELTAVIGINGAGKSTLLKTITGNLSTKSGQFFLSDLPLTHYSSKTLAERISIVLTKSEFSQHLSVQEVVSLGRHPYTNWMGRLSTVDKHAIQSALAKVEIEHLAQQSCSALSDGQLQKVFIARALAQDTDIIVLDEPTNHLDLYHKAFVIKLLKKLTANTQKAVVFATHELNLALELCDQIILINQGKITQDSPANLIKSGVLEHLFPEDLIQFDTHTNSFRVNKINSESK